MSGKKFELGVVLCALALAGGCSEDSGSNSTGGAGASGNVGAPTGAGGATATGAGGATATGAGGTGTATGGAGTGMTTGGAGTGMTTGGAGTGMTTGGGGTGGEPPVLSCDDAGADIRTGSMCEDSADGWFAIKTVIDVWWQGTAVRDPGRGDIEVYLLGKLEGVCQDGTGGVGTIKACGTRLPPFTSDVACDAFQIQFPDEMWDSPNMPRFTTTGSTTGFNPGDVLTIDSAVGLVGIDLMDGQESGTWPTSMETGSISCEAGTGLPCFPDHDNDGQPGITVQLRTDAADYTSDLGDGTCTGNGLPYKYRGSPTVTDIGAGGGAGGGVRAEKVRIGLRTKLGGAGAIGDDCVSGVGDSIAEFLDSRAVDCEIDPDTLPATDPRVSSGDTACTATEAQFVDDNVPQYIVLAKGETPGETMPPLGWSLAGRDIDKSASIGPRSGLVRLGGLDAAEPDCAAVRNAAFPDLAPTQ
jgi:hypothetical protein